VPQNDGRCSFNLQGHQSVLGGSEQYVEPRCHRCAVHEVHMHQCLVVSSTEVAHLRSQTFLLSSIWLQHLPCFRQRQLVTKFGHLSLPRPCCLLCLPCLQWAVQCLRALHAGDHEEALLCAMKALGLQPDNNCTVRSHKRFSTVHSLKGLSLKSNNSRVQET
jgi:hypothetical protein